MIRDIRFLIIFLSAILLLLYLFYPILKNNNNPGLFYLVFDINKENSLLDFILPVNNNVMQLDANQNVIVNYSDINFD